MAGNPYVSLTMSGTFGGPGASWEIWSATVAMTTLNEGDQAEAAATLHSLIIDPNTNLSPYVYLTDVAIAYLDASHKQIGETKHFAQPADSTGAGASSASNHPSQVACRVSLSSGLRGRSQRGGFYLPTPREPIDPSSGLISGVIALNRANAVRARLAELNALDSGKVCIPSVPAGNVLVNQVRVGRALDTIRSRRNALAESYASVTL